MRQLRARGLAAAGLLALQTGAALAATAVVPGSADPWKGAKLANCDTIFALPTADLQRKARVADIQQCIQRGYDPAVGWRPPEGAGGEASYAGVADPAVPPYKAGAKASVSGFKINFSLKFPPWESGDEKAPGDTAIGGTACPEASDDTGVFGDSVALKGSASYNLACGGTMPLSTYQLSLSQSPIGLASTEYGSYYLWNYTNGGGSYRLAAGYPVALPTYLCTYNSKTKKMEKSVDLSPPVAQMIAYNSSMNALVLRMVDFNAESTGDLLSENTETPEKFLVLPMQNGVPQAPGDCANETDYLKTVPMPGQLLIEPTTQPACEGTAEQCGSIGASTSPTVAANCETVSTYPSGTTKTAAGPVVCTGKIQVMVTDRPNLVHLPGTTATTTEIEGRTAVMANPTTGSELYVSSSTLVRLPQSGQVFTFPNGGLVGLKDGGRLMMYGPASINTGTGQIMLTAGGDLRDSGGATVAKYTDGVALNPAMNYPIRVLPEGSINLPMGFAVPTQPNPYVRGPAGE